MYIYKVIITWCPLFSIVQLTLVSTKNLLVVPKNAFNRYVKCIFKMGAAILWNSITDDLKQSKDITTFKKRLKTYIFN